MSRMAPRAPRAGFTLIELLVVISIIAILASLLLAAVVYVLRGQADAANANDINQLKIALENFKQKYGTYPPSIIRLCSNYAQYTHKAIPNSLDAYSIKMLNKIWPKLTNVNGNFMNGSGIAWDGNYPVAYPPAAPLSVDVTLYGDRALVFFLGGIPQSGTEGLGFANDPTDPSNVPLPVNAWRFANNRCAKDRTLPFPFVVSRLQSVPYAGMATPTPPAPFFSYLDAYSTNPTSYAASAGGCPIVYFNASLMNQKNGYFDTLSVFPAAVAVPITQKIIIPDAFGAPNVVNPFYNTNPSANVFLCPASDSFQIVTAGRDQVFGPGGPWQASVAASYDPAPGANDPAHGNGQDDMTSFASARMGVVQ